MIKFPKIVKIGPYDYTITFPYKFIERTDLLGQHDFLLKDIRFSDSDGQGEKFNDDTLLWEFIHETFHAIDMVYGAKLFIDNEADDKLNSFIHGFLQVVRDNDKFIEILETIKKKNRDKDI